MPPDPRETEQQQATHTETPWEIGELSDGERTHVCIAQKDKLEAGGKGRAVCLISGVSTFDAEDAANARRIVACVNALAGWDVATIEFVAGIENPLTRVAALTTVADLLGEKALALLAETEGDAAAESAAEEAERYADEFLATHLK